MRVIQGDCLEVMPTLDAESIDAIVCDPPYGLSFMGKAWDHGVPGVPFWIEANRVAKPGAYLLAFGGTRTFHRLTVAIEDAGFEIQDCLSWLYGSGFPKHKSKLKPAWEPIIMARKPAPKATHLNVDACRIGERERERFTDAKRVSSFGGNAQDYKNPRHYERSVNPLPLGRWPANVCLDEEVAAMLDATTADVRATRPHPITSRVSQYAGYGSITRKSGEIVNYDEGDAVGASRFFYTAKAGRSEREEGLEGFPVQLAGVGDERPGGSMHERAGDGGSVRSRNHHPTVKPVDLMRWLVRLVAPPNGVVLDPFMGSGTTGIAAVLESKRFIGIEKEQEYCTIAEKRIAHWGAQGILNLDGVA